MKRTAWWPAGAGPRSGDHRRFFREREVVRDHAGGLLQQAAGSERRQQHTDMDRSAERQMTEIPDRASAVIIGAGIVGNSLAYHLARLGWTELVLVDKGPMPNPGGSTGHASNFIFPIEYSKMMMELTRDSTEQYCELGVFTESGGIEVARTQARMTELRRRCSQAKAWGIPAELLTPEGVAKLVPYLDPAVILGGAYFPTVGVVDSLRAGTLMRERAQQLGALTVLAGTEVLGIDTSPDGRVSAVRTSSGEIQTDVCAICCGVWSPRIAKMAGARIPLTPIVHQMISVGPIALFDGTEGEIAYPIVRDVDENMYERQHGGDMEVGSYAHRPIIVPPDDIPSIEAAVLSPTEMPFTQDDFDPQLAMALELMPDLLGDERAGIRYAINGLISMTPDGHPLLGEMPEVPGLWSVAASWIKEGPGIGRAVAEWMSGVTPEIDIHEADIARFYAHQRTTAHVSARAAEGFNKMYGIVHPAEQWESGRPLRLGPAYQRERELGAVFHETAGWERPFWYDSNSALLDRYAGKLMDRGSEWESRWWSPIINAEHLAMRDAAGLFDLSAFAIFDITGPGALAAVQSVAVAQMHVPFGRVIYTSLLDDAGGFRADLTIMRLGPRQFRVVTGGATGMMDLKWFTDHLPGDGSAHVTDLTSAWTTLGLWGPRARDILQRLTADDVTNDGFPFGTCREIELAGMTVLASRISYVGELGWELHVPIEQGARLWDEVFDAGLPNGLIPAGIGVYGTTARLEKGYRAFGAELDAHYNLVEAGMTRPRVKEQEFVGKAAYLAQRQAPPAAVLCTLVVDDHVSESGDLRYMLGGEPVLTEAGGPLIDARGRRSYVTSAGSGPSVGKHLLMAYLPPEQAVAGTPLMVEYMSELYPVTVAVAGSAPLFDPANERIRC
jgi:glycine cleavage system aminomethyltransferase T/glycine/D-amino acid oxidase-like deaminating enzyme